MKKVTSLFLALVMCLSLCACGASNDTPKANKGEEPTTAAEEPVAEPTEAEPTEAEPTEAGAVELVLGETYSLPLFDITITGFDFTEKATFPEGGSFSLRPQDGYVTANLYYDVNYTGKTKFYSTGFSPALIDYNDGYIFNLETFYYYDTGVDAWLNSGDIDPLCPEFSCKACFFVPLEVSENTDAPLFVKFNIGDNGVIYKVR